MVLDPACGGRQFYFDKTDDRVLFGDIRVLDEVTFTNNQRYSVQPDQVMDFRDLPFPDESFGVIVFDPPHSTRAGGTGWLGVKYGFLNKETWRDDIRAGFAECFRVLRTGGVLIFKWAETDIKVSELLQLTEQRPLVGHKSGKQMGTHWITFIKESL
jgi:SAM-dependent methyltransferase